MKAEHRHELKTNDLAKSLVTFGDYAREYGMRVALGLVIIILVIVLVRNRIQSSRAEAAQLRDSLAVAREEVAKLQQVGLDREGRPSVTPEDGIKVGETLTTIKEKSSDKAQRAEALALEGDLYWNLANYPNIIGSTAKRVTPPSPEERSKYLKQAKAAYEAVISQYGEETLQVVTARLGLAAVAENASDWAEAQKQYQAVRDVPNVPKLYKDVADFKLKRLGQIKNPAMVGLVPEKLEIPAPPPELSTQPSTTQSTTAPTTGATTKPGTSLPAKVTPATTRPATTKPVAPKKETTKPKTETPKVSPTTKPATNTGPKETPKPKPTTQASK